MTTMTLRHVDTCLGCYLLDHHNRPGELLLGVPVDGATTLTEVRTQLESEISAACIDGFDYDAARAAVAEQWSTVADASVPFDASLDSDEADDDMTDSGIDDAGESCQAWFVLSWDAPDATEA